MSRATSTEGGTDSPANAALCPSFWWRLEQRHINAAFLVGQVKNTRVNCELIEAFRELKGFCYKM